MIIVVMFIVLVGGGWLLGKLVGFLLFPEKDFYETNCNKKDTTTINNYTTENHLHISKEDFKKLIK
ncbi:MAG: hypothetical protein ACK5M1_11915 [Xanthomarina gelatinilytica]|uniref:hypothetical protein n=1 Tax=Xanthomarina gelatinilytica TaxID=1137281 RepID=UPI003A8990BE